MTAKKTVVSMIAALALSASIAGPALAGPPTFTGPITCSNNGTTYEMGLYTDITKKEIAANRKLWVNGWNFCDKGSVDTSALVKNKRT